MTASVPAVPAANGATPYLTIRGAAAAIEFYQRVFDARVELRLDAPDGVMHAELVVGGAKFMLTEERASCGALSPLSLNGSAVCVVVYVPDVDATVKAAEGAGAKVEMPVADQFWGDRMGQIVDPYGHKWMVATHKEDVSEAQLKERLARMFAEGQPH
ncbi:VOC family protein [Mitsuaria sp. GD03876]|uniref:VOC family protein n=1 Tax=Mitsuaria sp. GD03876 TaxID=2975399 RepID=UPI002447B3C0|nr:VOC family protein [Mitsuaria sp. GD03876]MDH0864789.1 VOC family protein [Mitsuaria sp. GD03876]